MVPVKGRRQRPPRGAAAAESDGTHGQSTARAKNKGGLRRRGEQPVRGVGSGNQAEPEDGSKSPNTSTVKTGGPGRPDDPAGPDGSAPLDGQAPLDSEIAMMRVLMRRVFEHAGDCQDVAEWSQLLGALGAAATRLATLLRTQKALAGGESAVAEALREALRGEAR